MNIYNKLIASKETHGAGFLMLVDPDKYDEQSLIKSIRHAAELGADAILIGGSVMITHRLDEYIRHIKAETNIPIVIFPGSIMQISGEADAILYISLVSGRNADYLIGNHVIVSPIIRQLKLETISTAYMLIDSGRPTSASFISNSFPIPRNKPEIAAAHALAAEYIGMKTVYLEGGSGAEKSVPEEMIYAVSKTVKMPVITGGGIRTPEDARRKVEAGSSFVVVGNILEERRDKGFLQELIEAVHIKSPKTV
jgi:phosphoglycerol geranylgeranyltransferase